METKIPNLSFGNNQDVLVEPRKKLNEEQWRTLLRRYGLKITNQRLAILQTLNSGPKFHMTVRDVLSEARKKFPAIGEATVYRFLNCLKQKNIVSEISTGNSSSLYELKSKSFHYHINCIRCGKVIEFKNKTIENALNKIADINNFEIQNHSLELYIICNSDTCKNN